MGILENQAVTASPTQYWDLLNDLERALRTSGGRVFAAGSSGERDTITQTFINNGAGPSDANPLYCMRRDTGQLEVRWGGAYTTLATTTGLLWGTISPASGWAASSGAGVRAERHHRVTILEGYLQASATLNVNAQTWQTIGTVQSGYWPIASNPVAASCNFQGDWRIKVTTGGVIQISPVITEAIPLGGIVDLGTLSYFRQA